MAVETLMRRLWRGLPSSFRDDAKRVMRSSDELAGSPPKPGNNGYCHCCRTNARFHVHGPWLRDEYVCGTCGSIPRQRHINYVLDTCFPDWGTAKVHESSPSHDFLARSCPNYSASQLLEGVPLGESAKGIRCEDLEQLTFPDAEFDLFVTQDVLEHVFRPDVALRETMRVLRPGGAHVFTAPKQPRIGQSYARAIRVDGTTKHLQEPQYHGSPVGDGRALVTWDYGRDFESLLSQWTGYPTTTFVHRDRDLGLEGEHLEVFVIRKDSHNPNLRGESP
jgi:SAM-dependent methyltransferase